MDEKRRKDLKEYQRRRTERRRARGLTVKTIWIREEDTEAFAKATQPFVDHARLIEGVTGSITLEPSELKDILERNQFPYTLDDLMFLINLRQTIILKPREEKESWSRASEILQKYGFKIEPDELVW